MSNLDYACEVLMRFARHEDGCTFESDGFCQCGLHDALSRLGIGEYRNPPINLHRVSRTGAGTETYYFVWQMAVP